MNEQERFGRCLAAVLSFEGGFADDPRDRGGPTNLGVTLAALSQALGREAGEAELKALTPERVRPIYFERYWRAVRCEALAAGVDLMLFDAAVNMGPGAAVRLLQGALGVRPDGLVGPLTLAAAARTAPAALIDRFARRREARYRRLDGFPVFGAGWLKRLAAMTALALEQAAEREERPA